MTLVVSIAPAQVDWFHEQLAGLSAASEIAFVHARWTEADVELPTHERLRELRRVAAGRPDHPEFDELQNYERRLANGPDTRGFSVWLGEPGEFRRNLNEGEGYADIVVHSNSAWSLAPAHLTVIDDLSEGFPQGYRYGPWDQRLRGTLSGFLFGAMSIRFPGAELSLMEFESEPGTQWTARLGADEPGIALEIRGVWFPEEEIGRARSAEVVRCDPAPHEIGRRWKFSDWRPNPIGDGDACFVQEEFAPDGRPVRRIHLEHLDPIDREAFAEVVSRPSAGGDTVRGAVTIPAIHRFPNGTADSSVSVLDAHGRVRDVIRESEFAVNRNRRLLRRAGVLAVTGAVVLVAVLRLRWPSGNAT
jgi:hypothetical protein